MNNGHRLAYKLASHLHGRWWKLRDSHIGRPDGNSPMEWWANTSPQERDKWLEIAKESIRWLGSEDAKIILAQA
jgi:hypothetical protein